MKHLFNWLFPKRYFVEFEATDYSHINFSQVKIIKADTEDKAREKFDDWAMEQDFWRYSVMDVREVRRGR